MIKFFIVTPSYNQVQFLERTIESVLQQKGDFELEYWVLDGASDDGSREILEKYHQQLNWRSEKDEGQVDAINQGLELMWQEHGAQKKLIFCYLNSDDTLEPGALQAVATQFKKNPDQDWLVGDAKIINAQDQAIQKPIQIYKKIWRRLWQVWPQAIYLLNPIPQPATFIRASLTKKIGHFKPKLKYAMDYDYWLRCLKQAGKPILLKQSLANFRIHEQTKGTTGFREQFTEQLTVATSQTQNKFLLALHRLHNQFIFFIYQLIK